MGAPRAIALCQCFSGALEYQAGHWDKAEKALQESIHLYRELGAASGEALAWQRLGVLLTAQGKLNDGKNALEEGIVVAERAVMRAHCLGRLYASMTRNRLLSDDLPGADHYLSLGIEMSQRHGNCATCNALLLPAAVSLRIAQGETRQAQQFCEHLDAAAEKYTSKMWVAMAKQARGEYLAHTERVDEAIAEYERASEAYRSAGHDYEAARCLKAAAGLYAVRNAPEDGQRAVETRRIAESLLERLVT